MSKTMHHIIDSGDDGNLEVVSGENLRWLIDESVSFFIIFNDMFLHKIKVDIWSP